MKNISLIDKIEIIERKVIGDERGWLLKTLTGKEKGLPNHTGEIYTVCGLPNHVRGGHYHKLATEWFTVLSGETKLKLLDIITNETMEVILNMDTPVTIVVPPSVAHQFENHTDREFLLLAYSDVLYDPSDTIICNL